MTLLIRLVALLALPLLAACAAHPNGPSPGTPQDKARLEQAILAMGPGIDPVEASRAAQIAYDHTHQLAQSYQITDPPLVHNTKVNMGLKPRGLCWHWAKDIEERLNRENFATLQMHRAIANADNIRLEHSTAIISRAGDSMYDGLVLDPWRKGGVLFWARLPDDTRYDWYPRNEVLAAKLGHDRAQALLATIGETIDTPRATAPPIN